MANLNRNISQVRIIFYLTCFVIIIGFSFIFYGAFKSFENPKNFDAAVVVTIAGVIINFLGASFLLIYKSTMEQARIYVTVLERINAVGMSVQVIESISDSKEEIKQTTKAEIALKLIELYTIQNSSNNK